VDWFKSSSNRAYLMKKFRPVYAFEEADSKNRMLLGGKGAGLSEMTRL